VNRQDAKHAEAAKGESFLGSETNKKLGVLGVLGVLAILLSPSSAGADPYGEPPMKRKGFAIGAALGPSVFKGAGGMDELQGVGGSLDLRVGTSAAANLLWLVELVAGGYLVEVNSAEVSGGVDQTYNALTTLTFGGQLYIREALWLRGGVGFAGFVEREGRSGPVDEDTQRAGLAVIGGGGYDFFRRGRFALSLEVANTIGAFRNGALGQSSVVLGLAWY
jgi:hypothetical protein